jgi:hypothetical protein
LLLARIEERHIHVIARDGTPLHELPEASLMERSDLVPSIERGVALGGGAGLLAGLVAMSFPPAGLVLGGGAVLAMGVVGVSAGAFASSLIGVSAPSTKTKQFHDAIAKGEILMLIDVPTDRESEIRALVAAQHPQVDVEGTDPKVPYFP